MQQQFFTATNRKELLDPALTRPGRFDRSIDVTLPDIEGRKHIFMIHLKPLKLDPAQSMEEYAKRLATLTPGFSGAEIHNLCNEAAILAARKNKKFVSAEDFEAAAERVMAGLEKKKIVTEEERRTVAVHESGHAVVSWFLEGGNPLLKVRDPNELWRTNNFIHNILAHYHSTFKGFLGLCSIFAQRELVRDQRRIT